MGAYRGHLPNFLGMVRCLFRGEPPKKCQGAKMQPVGALRASRTGGHLQQQQMPELFCRMHLVLSRKYQNSSPYAGRHGTILCWQVVLSLTGRFLSTLGLGVDCAAALEMRIRRSTSLGEKL